MGSGLRELGRTPPPPKKKKKILGKTPSPVFAADVDIKSCPCNKLLNKQCFTTDYIAK